MSGYNSAGSQLRDSLEASLENTLVIMIGLGTSLDMKHGDVCFVSSARSGLCGLSKMLEVLSDWLETQFCRRAAARRSPRLPLPSCPTAAQCHLGLLR